MEGIFICINVYICYTYTELYVQTMQMLEGIIADFIFGTFSVHMHLTVLELARAGEEEERKKDERFFFQTSRFLSFYKAELKSEASARPSCISLPDVE